MHIMTKDGWKQLSPRTYALPIHVPSMLEQMGIDDKYNGVKAMSAYCEMFGNGVYFTYKPDGTSFQSKAAIHPLEGMF